MQELSEEYLNKIIGLGEETRVQFKEKITDIDSLTAEMVAFSNALGGLILVGVSDKSEIIGIESHVIRTLNQAIANSANQKITPAIYPQVTIWELEGKNVLVINIPKGTAKPYSTNKGIYWTKVGSDKRKLSREELLRLFQESGSIMVDELLIQGTECQKDIDLSYFYTFFEKQYGTFVQEQDLPFCYRYVRLSEPRKV